MFVRPPVFRLSTHWFVRSHLTNVTLEGIEARRLQDKTLTEAPEQLHLYTPLRLLLTLNKFSLYGDFPVAC